MGNSIFSFGFAHVSEVRHIYFPGIFTEIGFLCDINLGGKKKILIDLYDKVTMSELFDTVAFVRTV